MLSPRQQPKTPPGIALRVARVLCGFNLRDLSERSDIDATVISRYESGTREISPQAAEILGRAIFSSEAKASR
jgi:hypothetical protein